MMHVRLGTTGLKVSRACLGTMTFGYQCDPATSFAILDRAAELGVTFLDTADAYPLGAPFELLGRTEELLGQWLAGRRDDFVVATKCYVPTGRRPWQGGLSRQHVLEAIDASLRRLGTDHVDLYQVHFHDADTPLDETLSALQHLVDTGKVRYVGVSNWLGYQVMRALGRADLRGWARVATVQPRYNLLYRPIERELLPLCREEGVGVIPYNPLAGGLLTGKHAFEEGPTEGTRFTLSSAAQRYQTRYWHGELFATVEELKALAADAGMSLVRLSTAWVAAQPGVTAPIVGASRPDQLDESVAGCTTTLDDDLLARLDELTTAYRNVPLGI